MFIHKKYDPTLGELAMGETGTYVSTGVEIRYPGMSMRMECESQEEVDQIKDMLQSMFDIHQRNQAKQALKPSTASVSINPDAFTNAAHVTGSMAGRI